MIFSRRSMLAGVSALAAVALSTSAMAQAITLRLSAPASATDQRAIAMMEVFGPAVKGVADFQPHWNATLFKQGTAP